MCGGKLLFRVIREMQKMSWNLIVNGGNISKDYLIHYPLNVVSFKKKYKKKTFIFKTKRCHIHHLKIY